MRRHNQSLRRLTTENFFRSNPSQDSSNISERFKGSDHVKTETLNVVNHPTTRNNSTINFRNDELSEIQLRARHYLQKYKIVNDPFVSFSLVNIIIEERERMGKTENSKKQEEEVTVNTQGTFLPSLQTKSNHHLHQDRHEVIELAKWLDTKLNAFRSKQKITITDILDYKQTVLNMGLGEIIRMVGDTCRERANLLRSVWDSTFQIFEHVLLVLTKHSEQQEKEFLQETHELRRLYEQKVQFLRKTQTKLKSQYTTVLEHFKNLIIANRSLKRQKKCLQLKYRMMQYSQQSYRQGYTVALEMALQSGDGNIMQWARKILSKLIREKQRRRKNYNKAVTDQDVYRHAKDVVFDWLKRNTDDFSIGEFKQYSELNLLDAYAVKIQRNKKDNRRDSQEVQEEGDEEGSAAEDHQQGKRDNPKHVHGQETVENVANRVLSREARSTINSPNPLDFLQDENPNDVDIYEYFKTHNIGTAMDVTFTDCCTGQHLLSSQFAIQTQGTPTADACTMTDPKDTKYQGRRVAIASKNHISIGQIEQSNECTSEISSISKGKVKKVGKKGRKRTRSSMTISKNNKKVGRNSISKAGARRNLVDIKKRGLKKKNIDNYTKEQMLLRSASAAFIASELENRQPKPLDSELQLNKFEDIFEQERDKMMKNQQLFVRRIRERRSFIGCYEAEYGNYLGYERSIQKWAILPKPTLNKVSVFNEFTEIAKKIKQVLEKNIQNAPMKKKIFRQNTQIFGNVSGNLQLATVRDQKAPSTLNALNKVFSSLLVQYVRQVKKDKQDKDDRPDRQDKYFYPLNALYVDKFIHTYGLKDIAEKNMASTLRNILGLTHRYEKMRLFAILLGIYDKNVGGDELQIYVKSLVYFDNTGKVSLQMRDFNIERLATDRVFVQQNILKVCEGIFSVEDTKILLEQIQTYFKDHESISIETIVLHILQSSGKKKASQVSQYLPLHNYLVNHRTFLSNITELIRLLQLPAQKEVQTIQYFAGSLDLTDDSHRCITAQRFIPTCMRAGLPTITEMCSILGRVLHRYQLPESFKEKLQIQANEQRIRWLLTIREEWELPIENSLLQELEMALQHGNKQLTHFWWLVTLVSLIEKRVQQYLADIMGTSLNFISLEVYFVQFRKGK